MNTKMIVRGLVAMVGILGFAPSAPAKSLQALLYAGNYSQGTTFLTCNSNSVWAQASGWDSGGSLRCLVRQFNNNLWVTTSVCDASATQENASLRSTGNAFCTSPKSAWGGGQVCSVNNLFLRPNSGACVNAGTVFSFSNTTF
jgi:hypothetical protein